MIHVVVFLIRTKYFCDTLDLVVVRCYHSFASEWQFASMSLAIMAKFWLRKLEPSSLISKKNRIKVSYKGITIVASGLLFELWILCFNLHIITSLILGNTSTRYQTHTCCLRGLMTSRNDTRSFGPGSNQGLSRKMEKHQWWVAVCFAVILFWLYDVIMYFARLLLGKGANCAVKYFSVRGLHWLQNSAKKYYDNAAVSTLFTSLGIDVTVNYKFSLTNYMFILL